MAGQDFAGGTEPGGDAGRGAFLADDDAVDGRLASGLLSLQDTGTTSASRRLSARSAPEYEVPAMALIMGCRAEIRLPWPGTV